MNILFLTVSRISEISDRGIYTDLMRKFGKEGHMVYILTPLERRYKENTILTSEDGISILKVRTLNFQKTHPLEKWLAALLINHLFLTGIRKFFKGVHFDLIIYSTPPITFTKLICQIKRTNSSLSYLLLKDIFPQNAVDLGYIKHGGLFHRYFLKKEKMLYSASDFIGCMSDANVDYLLRNNPQLSSEIVEVNPNSHELFDEPLASYEKQVIRQKYQIPADAVVFIFGGNLGRAQGIDFLIEFLGSQLNRSGAFFLIIGSGTEFPRIRTWFDSKQPGNALLIHELPKKEFNLVLKACDVGLIFLDRRFTIPNFPTRLLSYLENKMAVVAATDISTDLRNIIVRNEFGLWSQSGDIDSLCRNIEVIMKNREMRQKMGQNGYNFMVGNYSVNRSYDIILSHFNRV